MEGRGEESCTGDNARETTAAALATGEGGETAVALETGSHDGARRLQRRPSPLSRFVP